MEPLVNIALRAARSAGDKIVRAAERMDRIRVDEKSANDFVSDVDRLAEREIVDCLRRYYPGHRFLCEESGESGNPRADHLWVIDPLDGTTNFLRGIPHYAVSIACLVRGRIEHAVIYDPIKGEEFTASRGRGAYLNGRRLRVSGRNGKRGALFATGIPFAGRAAEHLEEYLQVLAALVNGSSGIRRLGAASLDLAYVAAGRFDAFWEMYLKPWDIAAGVLLVREAGGLVSDFRGGERFLECGHVVAATPRLFKPTLQVIERHLGHVQG